MTAYVLTSILWALAGLIVGYFLGRAGKIANASVVEAIVDDDTEAQGAPPARRGLWRICFTTDRVLGFSVILLSIVSVVVMALSLQNQQRLLAGQDAAVRCQTQFNAQFISALRERNEAAAQERSAQRELLTTPNPTRDPAISLAARDKYLAALAQVDARRDAHPLPDRPAC
jgi:hypothetical protein